MEIGRFKTECKDRQRLTVMWRHRPEQWLRGCGEPVTEILTLAPTGRLTLTIIRQIRGTVMCHFTPTKLANISKVITVHAAYRVKPT